MGVSGQLYVPVASPPLQELQALFGWGGWRTQQPIEGAEDGQKIALPLPGIKLVFLGLPDRRMVGVPGKPALMDC